MRNKAIRSMVLVAVLTALLSLGLLMPRLYGAFEQRAYSALRDLASVMADAARDEPDVARYFGAAQARLPDVRVSWIGADGTVRYDSDANEAALENHAGREEITEALAQGAGQGRRLSVTLGESTYYYALRMADGTVLRLARAQRSVLGELYALLPSLLLIAVLVLAIAVVAAELLTQRLVRPLNQMNLDKPDEGEVYEELSPLLTRLATQNRRIERQAQAAADSERALGVITDAMTEGLVVLSPEGRVLSINRSATDILGARTARVGHHYVGLCRDLAAHAAIAQALGGEVAETPLTLSGRAYALRASPVPNTDAESDAGGAVLLLLDVTAREQAEQARREFTANVSHELKTPLTTIAGYAEMMHAGLVAPEDMRPLSGRIDAEAKRMITLIEDIIALSRLDEGRVGGAPEPVAMLALARKAAGQLARAAEARGVTVTVEGTEHTVSGSRPVLAEMLFNLIDNGIRYNRTGGSVSVTVGAEEGGVAVRVADTGVGIPAAEQDRVFERFYRVDKSHTRGEDAGTIGGTGTTGGTGLGLAIVKHGAKAHHARVTLQSVEGEGTSVTLWFPGAGYEMFTN